MGYFASSVLNTCSSVWLWGGWTGVTAHWDPQRCVEGKSGVTVHLDPKVTLDMCGLSTPWVEGDLSPGPKVTLGVGMLSTPSVEDDFSPGSKVTLDVCGLSTSWVGDLSPWPKVTHDLSPGPEVSLDVCELATPWVEGDLSPGPKVTLGVGVLSTPWVGESSVTFYWDPRSTWICHVWYSLPDIWGGWHDLSPGPNVSLDVLNVRCPLAEMCGGATSVFDFSQCGQFGFCLFWKY